MLAPPDKKPTDVIRSGAKKATALEQSINSFMLKRLQKIDLERIYNDLSGGQIGETNAAIIIEIANTIQFLDNYNLVPDQLFLAAVKSKKDMVESCVSKSPETLDNVRKLLILCDGFANSLAPSGRKIKLTTKPALLFIN